MWKRGNSMPSIYMTYIPSTGQQYSSLLRARGPAVNKWCMVRTFMQRMSYWHVCTLYLLQPRTEQNSQVRGASSPVLSRHWWVVRFFLRRHNTEVKKCRKIEVVERCSVKLCAPRQNKATNENSKSTSSSVNGFSSAAGSALLCCIFDNLYYCLY